MQRNNNECLPLILTKYLTKKYPNCWDWIENFRNDGKDLPVWDRKCYIPIAGTLAITSNGDISSTKPDIIMDATLMAAIAPWRIYKHIYRFAKETEVLLLEQISDSIIPVEVLKNLPFPSIYIETQTIDDINGFFAHIENDVNDHHFELRLTIITIQGEWISIPLHLFPGGTVSDGLNAMHDEVIKQSQKIPHNEFLQRKVKMWDQYYDMAFAISASLVQLVLYICAQNSEIEADKEHEKIVRIPKSKEFIKDRYREIKIYNCGELTARILREVDSKSGMQVTYVKHNGSGTAKRPHIRRGHWHHYWTGKKDERTIILKWQPPTYIHKEEAKEMIENIEKE